MTKYIVRRSNPCWVDDYYAVEAADEAQAKALVEKDGVEPVWLGVTVGERIDDLCEDEAGLIEVIDAVPTETLLVFKED